MGAVQNKTERHDLIKEIIRTERLDTQSGLVGALRGRGVDCTQATISRDIKELKLTKVQSEGGAIYYAEQNGGQPVAEKWMDAFFNGYIDIDYSGNIVVVKTVIGMAPACALAIDAVRWQEVVGTLAGDDTILIVTKSAAASKKLIDKIKRLLNSGPRG